MSNSDYHAFMLRMQRVGDRFRPKWQFTLQNARDHSQHRFNSLGALMLFLEQQTEDAEQSDSHNRTVDTVSGNKKEAQS